MLARMHMENSTVMARPIREAFQYCPQCGKPSEHPGRHPFQCASCGFTWFFGPCTAVGGVVADDAGRVLFLRRENDPGKGRLGIPGGFVDPGESAEEAMRREMLEEVNLQISELQFLGSFPNTYCYKGFILPVTDVFFECRVDSFDTMNVDASEVAHAAFLYPSADVLDEMAFESNRRGVEAFLSRHRP